MHIANDITELTGHTPLVRLTQISPRGGGLVVAKLESFNPSGGTKGRVAVAVLDAAESAGRAEPGVTTIVEAAWGEGALAMAMVCAAREYRCVLVIPDSTGPRERQVLHALGAELLGAPAVGFREAGEAKADDIVQGGGVYFRPRMSRNPVNPRIHYLTTGAEIWRDSGGKTDVVVGSVESGGSLCGAGRRLKEFREDAIVVAGIGAGDAWRTPTFDDVWVDEEEEGEGLVEIDSSVIDEVLEIDEEMIAWCGEALASREGIYVGRSGAVAVATARAMAMREGFEESTIVAIVSSNGLFDTVRTQ